MPESKKQKTAACMALAVKKGKIQKSSLKGSSLSMYNSMSQRQLEDFCHGQIKNSQMKK